METKNYSPTYASPEQPKEKRSKLFQVLLIVVLLLIFGLEVGYIIYKERKTSAPSNDVVEVQPDQTENTMERERGIASFSSTEEFQGYLAEADSLNDYFGMWGVRSATTGFADDVMMPEMMEEVGMAEGFGAGDSMEKAVSVERVSETNVQVQGIDEPDIVKTDGKQIYYASSYYSDSPLVDSLERKLSEFDYDYYYPSNYVELTQIISALPVEEMGIAASIKEYGDLLLFNDILMVFDYDYIKAFNIEDKKNPIEAWSLKYGDKNSYVGARLYGDKLYLITNTYVSEFTPCPIEPFSLGEEKVLIQCGDIYRPKVQIAVDTTYNVSIIDVATGKSLNSVSFVGSSVDSEMYMSKDNIYISYYSPADFLQVIVGMFEEASDLFPGDLLTQLKKVAAYDISNEAKMTELETILEKYMLSLDSDEEMRIENEMENRMNDYAKKHIREFEETGIVKIAVNDLSVEANGYVPGTLLNQFAMDEYENNLRVATTSGGRNSMFSSDYSINDVYVLDKAMNIVGSVKDLGEDERIYSVRFISDKGYVVTFRETDPFYVLDLSNPKKPEMKGELKIPGYSSYLHPINKDIILGFGREDSNVKISMFDVSNPAEPKEVAKYTLKEYWSDILNTHHAFLMDEKYKVFFVPGSDGGYVFSYDNNKLELKKAVSGIYAQRALFINDYLYILGDRKIVVLDEKNWERIKEIEFK